jgi:hypothetical protein
MDFVEQRGVFAKLVRAQGVTVLVDRKIVAFNKVLVAQRFVEADLIWRGTRTEVQAPDLSTAGLLCSCYDRPGRCATNSVVNSRRLMCADPK